MGGGNGALAFAAYLGLQGNRIRLWEFPEFRESLKAVYEKARVMAEGTLEGEVEVQCFDSLPDALRDATIVMVVVPAFAHKRIAEDIVAHLDERAILVLNPGRTGGALEVSRILRGAGLFNPVAEAQSLLFACRRKGEITVRFGGVKNFMRLGVFPADATGSVMNRLAPLIAHFRAVPDVRTTSFGNIGAVFHPTSMLLNLGIVQSGRPYEYYPETMTPAVVEIIKKVDQERVAVASKIGAEIFDVRTWLRESYGLPDVSLDQMLRENMAYKGVLGPTDVLARYVTEDVPTGLVPIEAVAKKVSISTPAISALISLAEVHAGEDYRVTGRNLEALGLDEVSPTDYDIFFKEGWI
jgi:opine dehydrogenase